MVTRLKISKILPAIQHRLNNRRFWRDSGLLMLANAFAVGAGVIKTPATTWLLTKEEVGMIGVVTVWSAFLVFLTWPSSLSAATYHYVAKGYPSAFLVYLKQQSRASLLSVFGFLLCAVYWGYWQGNPVLASLFVIGGLLYPFTDMLSICAGMLGAQEKFVGLFWYRIGRTLSRFTGFIFLIGSVWWFNPVATFYAANQAVMGIFQLGVAIWLVWQLRQVRAPPMPPEEQQEMLRYGKHQTGITVISQIGKNFERLLISTFLPLTVMADYLIGLVVYTQLKQLWTVYLSVRYPPLVRLPKARRKRQMFLEGVFLTIGLTVFSVILAFLAFLLIPFLLPESYMSSLNYICWLLAAFVAAVPGFWTVVYFRTEQDEKKQYMMQTLSAIFGVTLPSIFMYPFGIYGVLFGGFLSSLIYSMVGIWIFWRSV